MVKPGNERSQQALKNGASYD